LSIVAHTGTEVKHLPKVFVVDNDPAILASLEALFTAQGYAVRCFSTAEGFYAQHHRTEVGCLVVDLMIPGMGGSELLRQLQESGSVLSVVVITGLFSPAVASRTGKLPVKLLEKPYEVATLLKMVEDGIAGSIRRRAIQMRSDKD
jgi:FixJ family two-component response regulator